MCETSGIHKNDSVIHIYVYTHTHAHIGYYKISSRVSMLYSRVLVNHLFYVFVVVQLLS